MNKNLVKFVVCLATLLVANTAFAQEATAVADKGLVALGAGIGLGLAVLGGGLGMGRAVSSACESVGRNPASAGKLMVPMILGLALIEGAVILAFVVTSSLGGKV